MNQPVEFRSNHEKVIEKYRAIEYEREYRRCLHLGIKNPTNKEKDEYINNKVKQFIIYQDYNKFYEEFRFFKLYFFTDTIVGLTKKLEITFNTERTLSFNTITENYINYKDIVLEGYNKYVDLDFSTSKYSTEKYSKYYLNKIFEQEKQYNYPSFSLMKGKSIEFIESIKTKLDPENKNFQSSLFERWVLYHCWDKLNEKESIERFGNAFLDSTKKLLGKEKIDGYLKNRFSKKENLFIELYKNFTFDNIWKINRLNEYNSGYFHYTYTDYMYEIICGNEIMRSIRIIENEMRIDFGQKIIGSFYNEDILFRTIKNTYGLRYKVISQGSPEWLKPQRIDVYFPELNLGIEYQGEQHFKPVDFGGKGIKTSMKQFVENQKRDIIKKEKCDKNNCVLLEMNFNDDINVFLNILSEKIEELEKSR